jgi:hypothetical protein
MLDFFKDWKKTRKIKGTLRGTRERYITEIEGTRTHKPAFYPPEKSGEHSLSEYYKKFNLAVDKIIKNLKKEGNLSEQNALERLNSFISGLEMTNAVETSLVKVSTYGYGNEYFEYEQTTYKVPLITQNSLLESI